MQIKICFPLCICSNWPLCREIKILLPWTRHKQPGVQDPSSLLSSPSHLSEKRHMLHTGTVGPMELQCSSGLCCRDSTCTLCVTCQDLHSSWEQPFLLQPSTGAKEAGHQTLVSLVHWSSSAGPHAPWVLWLCAYQCAQACQYTVLCEWWSSNPKWWEESLRWLCFWKCLMMFLIYISDTL